MIYSIIYGFHHFLDYLEQYIRRFHGLKVIENGQAEMKADVKTVQKDTTDLKIELTEVKGDIKTLDSKFDDMNKRLEKVEGTQKNQIWTLITVLSGSLLAVGFRSFFIDNNP